MRHLICAAAALVALSACPKKEAPKAPVKDKAAEVVDAGPPPAPKVELPAPRPLPTTKSGRLAALEAPADNAITPEKAELGWMLFFDKRLSKDGSKACADCHNPDKNYATDATSDSKVGGGQNKRNSPTLTNIAYAHNWYWDGRAATLEAVSEAAWKGQLGANPGENAMAIGSNATYKALFQRAFNENASATNIPQALATFFRTLQSTDSPWDKYEGGNIKGMSGEAAKGWEVFKKKGCNKCHVGPALSDYDFHRVRETATGADADLGRKEATKAEDDAGKFKTPTLRGVAQTAPYFHDGVVKTLEDAIDKMATGDPKKKVKGLDPKLKQGKLTPKEKSQLKAFLEATTSEPTWPAAPEKLPE